MLQQLYTVDRVQFTFDLLLELFPLSMVLPSYGLVILPMYL